MPELSPTSSHVRVALLGTYPPRRCGIATFPHDLGEDLVGAGDAATPAELEHPVRIRAEPVGTP